MVSYRNISIERSLLDGPDESERSYHWLCVRAQEASRSDMDPRRLYRTYAAYRGRAGACNVGSFLCHIIVAMRQALSCLYHAVRTPTALLKSK